MRSLLDRLLQADAPKDRPPGYRGDLYALYQHARKGVRSQGDDYRFHSLKSRYRKEYAELAAEAGGRASFYSS